MGTEVLRPHDVLADRFRFPPTTSFHRRKNFPAHGNLTNLIVDKRPQGGHNKKTSPRHDKKRQQHAEVKKPTTMARRKDDVTTNSNVGKVTLLRRGESLDSLSTKINSGKHHNKGVKSPNRKPVDDLAVCGSGRIGPESPVMLPKQIRVGGPPLYAGSAFSMSPSPRSLPLPSFFNKQSNEDPATRDLRRLLRLE